TYPASRAAHACAAGRATVAAAEASRCSAAAGNLTRERRGQERLIRCVFGTPFRPVTADPGWLTSTVLALAGQMYEGREFSAMPILADALQDAGCEDEGLLTHCRGEDVHVRGCWVVDLLLGQA